MRLRIMGWAVAALLSAGTLAAAAGPGAMRGIVHDAQHRPIAGAQVTLRARTGGWTQTAPSNADGEVEFDSVPDGDYDIEISAPQFAPFEQQITIAASRSPVLHFQLEIAATRQTVEVSGAVSKLNTQSSTVSSVISPQEIVRTPGADQTNSLAMITDYVPGASMVHDMLHMRGGHQVNWFFDGIPVINTNIAANVAPLINPKNVESLEVERGGYSAEYGDRTYGFFNVVTPSGFERDNEADLVTSYGNFHTTDDQLSFGGHTERFAYYASVDGNRSDLGLETPTPAVIHDRESGLGGFLSILYNPTPRDQVRWIVSVRQDRYQIPNDPDSQAAGIRDLDLERDDMVGFHWAHTMPEGWLFTLSPYFHFNQAHYLSGPADRPFVLDDNARSAYLGLRTVLHADKKRHKANFGFETWGEHNNALFSLMANPGSAVVHQQERHWANSESLFLEDQYNATSWLKLDAGVRLTHYGGLVSENGLDPRLGVNIRLPRLNWVLRANYSYYYQPPPLNSVSGPLLQFALHEGLGFVPLPGERDIQRDLGLTIPLRGWAIDVDNFHTNARNFLDHDVIGNSGIFIPLAILAARISGTEVAVSSPELLGRARLRIAYSNQLGEGLGPITGGLLQFADTSYFLLDHDQRNTASAVLSLRLPWQAWLTPSVSFGSGFLNGDGPAHLPPHTTADLALGKSFKEKLSVSLNATNLLNNRYQIDESNTFGGTHFVNPRQIYGEVRYRFHF